VHSRTKTKDRVGPLKDSAGNVVNDDKSMCEILNNFLLLFFYARKWGCSGSQYGFY